MKLSLSDLLFHRSKTPIPISKDGKSTTNTQGARGIGLSKHHNGRTQTATLSGLALCIANIFTNLNPLTFYSSSNGAIFGYVNDGRFYYSIDENCLCFSHEDKRLHGVDKLLPFIALHFAHDEEFKTYYLMAENEYVTLGYVENPTLLCLCDNFYFSVAKTFEDVDITFNFDEDFFNKCLDDEMGLEPLPDTFMQGAIKESEAPPAKEDKSILEYAVNGRFLIPYNWNEDQKSRISRNKVLSSFISTEAFEDILMYCHGSLSNIKARLDAGCSNVDAIKDDILNLTLFGDPSGGKTTIANALGEALGLPVYTISQSKFSEEDTYWGKTAVVDGGFKTVATPFLDCFMNGGIAVLEEVNLVDPGVTMGALGNAIWSPFLLMKDGYEPVTRHPMCIIIGTKNIGTFGSRDVNEAFNNRFVQSFEIEEPTKKQFIEFLNIHEPDKKTCEWVYEAYSRICKYLKSPAVNAEDVLKNISFRSCLGALKAIQYGQAPKRALKNSITGKIAEIDKELGHKVYDDVVLSLTNLRR